MPQEPKRRHSRGRQGKRRASIRFELPTLTTCTNCHSKTYPHVVCASCGFYNGRGVVVKKKLQKNEAKE